MNKTHISKHIQHIGSRGEELVMDKLDQLGFDVVFTNTWYDITATHRETQEVFKVEVKSTCLKLKNGNVDSTMYGRFDFTEKKNIGLQRRNNIVYVFVVYINEEYEILGCIKASSLRYKRYITLSKIMSKHKLKTMEKMFTNTINNKLKEVE